MAVGCMIVAGQSPGRPDPLATSVGEPCKALVRLNGKPLIEYVFDAVQQTRQISHVAVVGGAVLEPVAERRGASWVPERGGVLDNFMRGCRFLFESHPDVGRVISVVADIPLLAPQHLAWFIDECAATEHDLYMALVPKDTMLQTFPSSRRTYTRTRDGAFCSGNLLLASRQGFAGSTVDRSQWNWALQNRKHMWLMPLKFGLWPSFRLVTGRMRLAEIEAILERSLGIRLRAVVSPFADHGMDVDKPFQLEIAAQALAARRGAEAVR